VPRRRGGRRAGPAFITAGATNDLHRQSASGIQPPTHLTPRVREHRLFRYYDRVFIYKNSAATPTLSGSHGGPASVRGSGKGVDPQLNDERPETNESDTRHMSQSVAIRTVTEHVKTLIRHHFRGRATPGGAPGLTRTAPAAAATALVGLGIPAFALADDAQPANSDTPVLEEVIVNAQRRRENLQDVPVTVTAMSQSQLDAVNVTGLDSLGVLVPSYQYSNITGWAQPRLRGIGTNAIGPGIENPVAVYVDGVYYASMMGAALEFANIDSVEVLDGPQGTLFGRNASGGLIQVHTRDPSQQLNGSVSVGYGNYNTSSGSFYVTGGITANIAADLSVLVHHQEDGYGRNLYTGTQIDLNDYELLRSKWRFTPSDNLKITLVADWGYVNNPADAQAAPGNVPLGGPNSVPPHDGNGPFDPANKLHNSGLATTVDYQLAFARFLSITAYRDLRDRHEDSGTVIANPEDSVSVNIYETHEQFTQEFQLSSLPGAALTWTLGAYYFHELSSWNPAWLTGGYFGYPIFTATDHNLTDSGALYAQVTREVFDKTNLTLGLRGTVERKRADIVESGVNQDGSLAYQEAASGSDRFDRLTWRAALDHRFSDAVMGYISYDRGFKSGGFNAVTVPLAPFKPEVVDAYELGSKTQLVDNRLRLNSSVYYYNYRDIQETSYTNDGILAIVNGASSHLYGLDLSAEARLTSNLTLEAGFNAEHAEFVSFPNAPHTEPAGPPFFGNNGSQIDASGYQLPYAPKFVYSVAATYTLPTAVGRFGATASDTYDSGWFGEPDNRLHQGGYNVINLQGGWTSPHDFGIKLWAKNLTNRVYELYASSSSYASTVGYADPRTFGITFTQDF
jgi:iron complex outermembrane recepter protein